MSNTSRSLGQTDAGPVEQALRRCYTALLGVAGFSGVINVLALTGSLYMLQIYDRVLPSRSVPTLVGLTILLAALYFANGLLDFLRVRIMSRVGVRIDNELREKVFGAVQLLPLRMRGGADGLQPVRDLDHIRGFLSGMGPTAFFDMPWVPVYLGVIFLLHPSLGMFAVCGALLLVAMTLATEWKSTGPMKAAAKSGSERISFGEIARRNAEVIRAMGLGPQMQRQWAKINGRYLSEQLAASDATTGIGAFSKVARLMLQSGILGLGAYLVIQGEVSAGTIIAGSIIMSRALAPIEMAITHWRSFVSARQSHNRLVKLFQAISEEDLDPIELPKPQKVLAVQNLAVAPPGVMKPIVQGVNFTLAERRGSRHHRTKRIWQIDASARARRCLATCTHGRKCPPRWRNARSMGTGKAWPAHRLSAPGHRTVSGHRRREHRPFRPRCAGRIHRRSRKGRWRARYDRAPAQWLPD